MFTEMEWRPLQSPTHLTRVAGAWLDMIMCCWHQKKCWRAQRATAGSKHVIYGRGNGLASAGATLPSISHTNLDARVWLWLPAIGWCITWIAVSTQQELKSAAQRDWLSTFFWTARVNAVSLLCILYYTRGGSTVYLLMENRSLLLLSQQLYESKLLGFVTYCTLNNTCHGLPGDKVTSRLLRTATSRFPHTSRIQTNTWPCCFGEKYHPLLETGGNKEYHLCCGWGDDEELYLRIERTGEASLYNRLMVQSEEHRCH